MSQFYDQASLVMVPSGYKNGKVYSQKPLSTDGELTFTRASNATRVGPDGLIHKVRTNVALYSQDWTNWTFFQATATANTTANPLDGAVNADTLTISTSTTGVSYRSVATGTALATFSVYLKAGTHDQAAVGFTDGTDFLVNVDLTLGTITSVSSGITGTITSVGSGWYRVTATRTISTTSTPNAFVNVIVGTVGDSVIVFGAQVELGDIATDYIPTTTAAVSTGPVSGLPRLDYSGGATCPSLLLEPQRTNLLPMSEQMNNATFWNSAGGALVITPNVVNSPDGTQNADSITLSNDTARYFVSAPISLTPSQVYTYSVYMKSASGTLDIFMSGVNGLSGQMKSVTTEWQRFTLTFTMHANGSEYFGIDQRSSGSSTSGTLYFWGAQVELGAYATSYIPTLSTSVTRVADAASKTGISSLIGQTEGTLFAEFEMNTQKDHFWPIISAMGATANDLIEIYGGPNSLYGSATMYVGGVVQSNIGFSLTLGRHKIAIAYANNNTAVYLDGTLLQIDTSCSVPAMTQIAVGKFTYSSSFALGDNINQTLLFPTRLTNAQLAELTA